MRVAFETHGCKLNQADTLKLSEEFHEAGFEIVKDDQPCDVYVLNSCTVTHVADRKGRNSARSAKKMNPNSFVVFTGCYAEREPQTLISIPEIDLVIGNIGKKEIVDRVIEELNPEITIPDFSTSHHSMNSFSTRTRAMVKIQEGCNQICAYCIVPKVRGREKSVPVQSLINQINHLSESGFKEIVLTGTQLGSYGFDLDNTSLRQMLASILENTDVPRLRVSSLQPQEIDADLLKLWADPRLCQHFHVPLQSGSNTILKTMRRRYTSEGYVSSMDRIRSTLPEASITSDVIVGFPGESVTDFRKTADLCKEVGFSDLHVFKFSVRPGTSAAYLIDNVDSPMKHERSQILIEIAEGSFRKYRESNIGKHELVLWEESSKRGKEGQFRTYTGLTSNYIKVKTESCEEMTGVIERVKLGMNHGDNPKVMTVVR
tara:strand:- start:688 stop:1980 length:1293 start_codon:yes stop_codon:yes gene_type:complete